MKTIKGLTYEQLRKAFELCSDRGDDFKDMVKSIQEDFLSFRDFEDWDYFYHCSNYYSNEEWCLDYNGDLCDKDSCVWVESEDEYYPIDDCVLVWTGRRSQEWFVESSDDVYCYEGEHFTYDALGDHDLVQMEGGDIEHRDNVYYWESDNEYHYEEEENTNFVREYHNGGYRSVEFNDVETKYRIGFEIEKEDKNIKESMYIDEFEDKTNNLWRKERDGSLDDTEGYELVSPTFDFSIKHIFEHINHNHILVSHINADYGKSCGGHINLSKKGYSGKEMFEEVKGYTPLLYALYYGRVNKNYTKGKSNRDLENDNEKYQAIRIHDNRIEFRIISAVPNVDVLKWRCELIETMLKYPCNDVRDAYYYFDTKFSNIIKKVYDTKDKYNALKDRLRKFTLEFEKISLKEKEDTPAKRRKALAKYLEKYKFFTTGAKVKLVRTTATPEEWEDFGEVSMRGEVGDIFSIKAMRGSFIMLNEASHSWYPKCMFELHEKSSEPQTLDLSTLKVRDKVTAIKTYASSEEWSGIGEVPAFFSVGDTLTIEYISSNGSILFEENSRWSYPSTMFALATQTTNQ